MWFGEQGFGFNQNYYNGGVGRISPRGLITGDFRNPNPETEECLEPDACFRIIGGLALAPNGSVWFTEHGMEDYGVSYVGSATQSGYVETFPLNEVTPLGRNPGSIALGPDGNMWFVNPDSEPYARATRPGAIGRITPGGSITEFKMPEHQQPLGNIVRGPDGDMWFLAHELNESGPYAFPTQNSSIGRITLAGQISLIPVPVSGFPTSLAVDTDGNIWFVLPGLEEIGKLAPTGAITYFSVPSVTWTSEIVRGPDGNMWFTVNTALSGLGRITPAGEVTVFPGITVYGDAPLNLAAGANGTLWFTAQRQYGATTIGSYTVPYVPAEESPPLIGGSAVDGRVLTASAGTWGNSPTAFAFQWLSCDASGSSCTPIAGSTGASYALSDRDLGRALRVAVTATGAGGSAQAQSAQTAIVEKPVTPGPTSVEGPPLVLARMVWRFGSARLFSKVLSFELRDIPAGGVVEVSCAKGACSFKRGELSLARGATIGCRRHSCEGRPLKHSLASLSLTSLFRGKRLHVGSQVIVRVLKAGWEGKSFVFTMRPAKPPRVTIGCVAPSTGAAHSC